MSLQDRGGSWDERQGEADPILVYLSDQDPGRLRVANPCQRIAFPTGHNLGRKSFHNYQVRILITKTITKLRANQKQSHQRELPTYMKKMGNRRTQGSPINKSISPLHPVCPHVNTTPSTCDSVIHLKVKNMY
jgi:hypothetical protein